MKKPITIISFFQSIDNSFIRFYTFKHPSHTSIYNTVASQSPVHKELVRYHINVLQYSNVSIENYPYILKYYIDLHNYILDKKFYLAYSSGCI